MSGGEAEVRAVLERLEDAVRRKDAAATVACFAEDVASYDLAPPLAQHGGSVRDAAAWQGWFDSWDGPIGSETRDLTVRLSGDLACAWSLRAMTGRKRAGEPDAGPVRLWFRATVVLERTGGAWRIAHAHNSVPFSMDGRHVALVALEP